MNTLAHRIVFASILLACSAGSTPLVRANNLNVSPVVVEIDSPRKAAAITLTNGSDRAVTYQVEALNWRQENGVDRYQPTDELVVVPPIFEIAPHSSQVVRVMLRVPAPSGVERTYRVLLEDITQAPATENTGIAFRFSHNLPVLVAPAGKINNVMQWRPCAAEPAVRQAGPAELCVRLRNAGNRRIKVTELLMSGNGWQQALPVHGGFNLLAGAEREWRAPRKDGQAGPLQNLQVRTAESGSLTAEAAQP